MFSAAVFLITCSRYGEAAVGRADSWCQAGASLQQLSLKVGSILVSVTLKEAERLSAGIISVAALKFAVEVLLLSAVAHLCKGVDHQRIVYGAAVSAFYSAMCLSVRAAFLTTPLFRIVILAVTVWLAFGSGIQLLYKSCVYLLLNAAIGGLSLTMEGMKLWTIFAGALCISIVCVFVSADAGGCVPVELHYGSRKLLLTALRDTGNTLKDPVTGRSVLVIGSDSAQKLTGLSVHQLRNPTETLCSGIIPGLRLIPYRTINNEGGMLLALLLKDVRIGSWRGSSLVAFAPAKIGNGYEALTGGKV